MENLRSLSIILILPPILTLAYDILSWFATNRIDLRTLEEWWVFLFGRPSFAQFETWIINTLDYHTWLWVQSWLDLPSSIALSIFPVLVYLIYSITYLVKRTKEDGPQYTRRD